MPSDRPVVYRRCCIWQFYIFFFVVFHSILACFLAPTVLWTTVWNKRTWWWWWWWWWWNNICTVTRSWWWMTTYFACSLCSVLSTRVWIRSSTPHATKFSNVLWSRCWDEMMALVRQAVAVRLRLLSSHVTLRPLSYLRFYRAPVCRATWLHDWVDISCPSTRHKIGRVVDDVSSQSIGLMLRCDETQNMQISTLIQWQK